MPDEFGELGEGQLQEAVNGILAFLRELRDRPLPQGGAPQGPFGAEPSEQPQGGPPDPLGAEEAALERFAKRVGGIPFTEVPPPPALPPAPDPLAKEDDLEQPEPEQAPAEAKTLEEPEEISPTPAEPEREEPAPGAADLSGDVAELRSLMNGLIERERELAGLDLPDDVDESGEGGQGPVVSLAGISGRLAQLEVLVHRAAVPKPMLLPDVGTCISPKTMLPAIGDTELYAEQTDTWDRTKQGENDGFTKVELQRIGFDDTEGPHPKLYAYYRTITRDSLGAVMTMSAETRVTVDVTEACA